MVAPINSVKHYVQIEDSSLTSGAIRATNLVDAVAAPATSTTDEVKQGAVIKAVYLEYWIKSEAAGGTHTKFQMLIEKLVAGQVGVTFAQMNNLMAYPNKKNVFYFTQGVLGDTTTNSQPGFREWMLIPKGKQRFGLGDKLAVTLSATGTAIQNCGFSTYKEYI